MVDGSEPERPSHDRRRSWNPLRNMMQHLTFEPPSPDHSGRESLIRRLSWRRSKNRSPSAQSDASASASVHNADPALCDACASLAADMDATLADVDAALAKAVNPAAAAAVALDGSETLVARLPGLEAKAAVATCPLCRLFWAVRVPGDGDGEFRLSAFSSRDANYLLDPEKMSETRHPAMNKAFLAVVAENRGPGTSDWRVSSDWFRDAAMLFRTQPVDDASALQHAIWGREMGSSADMAVARDWLRFCRSHHQGRCGHRPRPALALPGFRLIDCSTAPPQVVDANIADKEDYVALSYVAGSDTAQSWPQVAMWPQVVHDAAMATRRLGMRRLWVDRVCMPDRYARPGEWAAQAARMDDIFSGATLVIVAAHGDDAMRGLPGIGSTKRPAQPRYRFSSGAVTLVSSLADPRVAIERSAWFSRAWTYQEGLLARRRLIFTEQQMYWECEGMLCPEALALPLELYHDAALQRMGDLVRPGLFNGLSYVDGSWRSWKPLARVADEPSALRVFRVADGHVAAYTRRRLSRDADSLSAYLGLARHLERTLGRGRLGHVVGVPVWVPRAGAARTRDLFALATSFWHHRRDETEPEPRRRPHLPSWTWAGWSGAVELLSSIVVADVAGGRERKLVNYHYVSAAQLARSGGGGGGGGQHPPGWSYSPCMAVLHPDGSVAYDFSGPPALSPPEAPYLLHVSDPLVLDRVRARTHGGGWLFNDVSVDVQLSRGGGGLREYVERHARGEQMTVLWLVDAATVMLLVVERSSNNRWQRVGRARMAVALEPRDVVPRFGRLEALLGSLPLRRLGHDILLE